MGIIDAIQGNRVYLDTNIWIYALEGYPEYFQDLTQLFQRITQGDLTAVTSELSLAEALVKPFQNQNLRQQQIYKQFISNSKNLSVISISRDILIEASQLRANVNIKLPDAIHAATAKLTLCSTFLTNDKRFQSVPNISVVLLSQTYSP
ncbi:MULTISPECIES: type II toxin-antitoxin system VapC family toxin [Nostocales]|uniref:Twitching motility protein PilT n=3 Tax=Nostocales TaxID=1161 RepID=A0A0C1R4J4_9CYAN|nr:PIN domain-containing protein [Tolypothrix bouteillei]KAF3889315.1 type II toxin-antitoxin system VapC family toxin [Tolypothrix bouteillei VB521301]